MEIDVGEGQRHSAGWGYIEFTDHDAAIKGMKRQASYTFIAVHSCKAGGALLDEGNSYSKETDQFDSVNVDRIQVVISKILGLLASAMGISLHIVITQENMASFY